MFRNYLAAALRNLVRNRFFTFLNTLGLALGLTAALLAVLYVRHESSYDRFIPGSDRVYVVTLKMIGLVSDKTPYYFSTWMQSDFPGLQVARLMPTENSIRHSDIEFTETVGWADTNLFSLLPLPVLAGSISTALDNPNALVLTRRMARKYFGRDLPIGETVEIDRKHTMVVAAVIEDLPMATHLNPEIFASGRHSERGLAPLDAKPYAGNLNVDVLTYVAFPPETGLSISGLQAAMPAFVERYLGKIQEVAQSKIDVGLVPVKDFHLYPGTIATMKPHGNPAALAAIGAVGLLILAIAAVNFVNLMTARASRRAVEVGVRKVSGAQRLQLVLQFFGEALIYATSALMLAGAAATLLVPAIDANLAPGLAEQWAQPSVFAWALALTLVIGILGGVYPALVLSAFRPAAVLKGKSQSPGSGVMRQTLVLLQFGVLITLILGTAVIYRQTTFVLRDGLRIDGNQMLLLEAGCNDGIVGELRRLPGITGVACTDRDPVDMFGFTFARRDDGPSINMALTQIGTGFFELYGIQLRAGRFLDETRDADAIKDMSRAVINQAGVQALGFSSPEDALGRTFFINDNSKSIVEIVGVVPDFSFDLKTMRIPPSMYVGLQSKSDGYISLKLSGDEIPDTLDAIDGVWQRVGEPRPIKRTFVDQKLQSLYIQTKRQGRLIGALSATAITIAILGLLGLASFVAEQRTKEIGIRKAMGASKAEILRLLLWQFAKPVLWANVVAWPVGYFVMQRWLEGFAYHIELSPWMFIAASALALVIAVATVIGHTLLIARAQPVTALRYE